MYEIWKLYVKTTQVIVSVPKCWQCYVVTLTIDLLTPKCIGIFLSPSCIYVWNMEAVRWILLKLSRQNQSYCVRRLRTSVFTMFRYDLDLWPFDSKMYRHRPLAILHFCIKYESCTLKTTQVIVSEQKCLQSCVVTLTFDLLIPKCIGIFLSPSCIYVWKYDYESCSLKTTQVIVSEPKCWQSSVVTLTFELLTQKCIGTFLSPSCIYVWNMKAVRWKLLKLSCESQSVYKVPWWPWPLTFWPQNV